MPYIIKDFCGNLYEGETLYSAVKKVVSLRWVDNKCFYTLYLCKEIEIPFSWNIDQYNQEEMEKDALNYIAKKHFTIYQSKE